MDAKLQGETGTPPTWDLYVDTDNMIVPMIVEDEQAQQEAEVAAVLLIEGIPQCPSAGVDWLGFLSETTTFSAIDSQIRTMMQKAGHPDYYPSYDLVNDSLSVVASKSRGAT